LSTEVRQLLGLENPIRLKATFCKSWEAERRQYVSEDARLFAIRTLTPRSLLRRD
jgi:hypothetical protein